MPYKIVVDLSHNEQLEDFPEFSLGEDDYDVEYIDKNDNFDDFDLEDYDILFIGNIQHSTKKDKFTHDHLKSIKRFVGEGGGLLLASGAGGDNDIPMLKHSGTGVAVANASDKVKAAADYVTTATNNQSPVESGLSRDDSALTISLFCA